MKKEYILRDTITLTQKANNFLVKAEKKQNTIYKSSHNYLYDFSLLDKHITNKTILEEIKKQCIDNTSILEHSCYIHSQNDIFLAFTNYNGMIYFKPYKVYSNSKNKYPYIIMDCVYIDYVYGERNNIYNDFTEKERIAEHTYNDHAIEEYEIS